MTSITETMALAARHQQTGNLAQAEMLYRQVLDADAQHLLARFRLAVVCHLQGRLPEAIAQYRQFIQIDPGSAQAHSNLGLACAAQGMLADALESGEQAVRLQPGNAEFVNNLGTIHSTLGQREQAADAYRRALALKPDYPAAWNNLGKMHFTAGQTGEAVRCFQRALALTPRDPVILNSLGSALLGQGNAVEAANCFRQALRIRPDYAEARHNITQIGAAVRQWEEAAVREEARLAQDPADPKALAALGDLYHSQLGKPAEARRCFERVIALCPDDARARLMAAVLGGDPSLTRVPADHVSITYDAAADQFERKVQQRGDCSPALLRAALEPSRPGLDILDLGCGTGLCGLRLRDWARTLVGVDLSAQMLAQARPRGIYHELIHGDLVPVLQQHPDQFDLIVASDVLLFLGDLAPLFQAVHQALRPGGRFAFTVDLHNGPEEYRVTPWLHFAHSWPYIQALASRANLRQVRVQRVVFPRDGGHDVPGLVVILDRPPTLSV